MGFDEIYVIWFSEQPKTVREICSRVLTKKPVHLSAHDKKIKLINGKAKEKE